ncbi:hypothetical protein D1114_11630 [Cereibacter sphaeroides]|uniref:Uncharacterized protein n=1 Tax=Cereibacter sphaeroides TaxID=1063 RepID=A0AAX1UKI8_CERSP|nr:hypothetical protein D1114_11630 [Cereibacter sphaeroides]
MLYGSGRGLHWAAPWVAAPPPAVGSESLFSGGDERQESRTIRINLAGRGLSGLAAVGKQRRPGPVAMPDGGARVSGTARGLKERAFLW